jgi:hypothetical protein
MGAEPQRRSRLRLLVGAMVLVGATVPALWRWRANNADPSAASETASSAEREIAALLARRGSRPVRVPRFVVAPAPPRFPGWPVHTPAVPGVLFDLEDRDPAWAPAMEAEFGREHFGAGGIARLGLPGLVVSEIACRQTTCRVSFEFPARLNTLVAAAHGGLLPMLLVEEALGFAAPRAGGLRRQSFERNGERYERHSVVYGFDEASWEPEGYAAWVEAQRPRSQAFYRKAREVWKATGTERGTAGARGSDAG